MQASPFALLTDVRVNCPFYFKIGACRHGDKCERIHNRPTSSRTIIMKHMMEIPVPPPPPEPATEKQVIERQEEEQAYFVDFYNDVYSEMTRFGKLEYLVLCDNRAEHMKGNVYAMYSAPEEAAAALAALTGRYFAGKVLCVELSPVTDFGEAACRMYEMGECTRGGYCSFVHWRKLDKQPKKIG